jgi:type II secretory ATPase GspE/PulE/Tfp pilus assembly ATPase PilB-like protein
VLNEFNRTEKNIVTVEDPLEYALADVVQTAINSKTTFTFATALRSIFRQDPDIIMVGEMRDAETAHIAVQAALSGHLVLSTLHTNDAPSALTRLVDMGVEPFLVASVVRCVLAQRLVRTNCPHCLEWEDVPLDLLPPSVAHSLESAAANGRVPLAHGRGCPQCGGRKFLGRIAIHEVMLLGPELAELVNRNSPDRVLRESAIKSGMKTLFEDGLKKALSGVTTIQEVYRVAG